MKATLLLVLLAVVYGASGQTLRHPPLRTNSWVAFPNGGFEAGLEGWSLWSRDATASHLSLQTNGVYQGNRCAVVVHTGTKDWSLQPGQKLPVQPGDLLELSIAVRKSGPGDVTLCASTWSAGEAALSWSYAEQSAEDRPEWQVLRTRVFIPAGVVWVQPRLIGSDRTTVAVDHYSVKKVTDPALQREPNVPAQLSASNQWLVVTLHSADATFEVTDLRTQRTWRQDATGSDLIVLGAEPERSGFKVRLVQASSGLPVSMRLRLEAQSPEFVVTLAGEGPLRRPLKFPHAFLSQPGDHLVIPMNEGISYPVEDESFAAHRLIAYGGHGICMAFWGVTSGTDGQMAIIETPDDAAIQMSHKNHRLVVAPEWESQKGIFGYPRTVRYIFLDHGAHVSMAKRYRAYAETKGLLRTLKAKRQENPNVDLLIGAVNVWCRDKNPVGMVKELQAAGIDRILWSAATGPENLKALNELGVLTSRYDIYQDVMNPAEFPKLQWHHPDWTTAAWPQDIILGPKGDWIKGWGVEAKDNSLISCAVICDRRAPEYARQRIPPELVTHPYRCRFIDTTTAAPWNECYSTNHPMTRTESRVWKMKLLEYVSKDSKLVTGCETGHDASVPFLHYFEGMLSLGPYRVPDSGRRMEVIWTNVPPDVAKFQLGHGYRLPLWELVYHDCVVAQWYWGDYNNKLPALWNKRDLFNVLYGTPPMFMFNRQLWAENKDRFVKSYRAIAPHVRQSGYAEMLDHRFLTPDGSVQQTRFANGQEVTVNFGVQPFSLPNGQTLEAGGYLVKP
jgi:hypothetical protein